MRKFCLLIIGTKIIIVPKKIIDIKTKFWSQKTIELEKINIEINEMINLVTLLRSD